MIENNENKQTAKHIIFEIPEEIHCLVKISATTKGITMKKWILRAIMKQIEVEKTFE